MTTNTPQVVSMDDIKRTAETHFFDPESMRFFDSRISRYGYKAGGYVFFVTSERFHGPNGKTEPRRYTVRRISLDDSSITTLPDHDAFQAHRTARIADKACLQAAMEVK